MFVETIDFVKNITPITFFIGITLYLFRFIINNVGTTDIEMKLMKPQSRFLVPFSLMTVSALGYSCIFVFVEIASFRDTYENDKILSNMNFALYLLIVLLIYTFLILIILSVLFVFVYSLKFCLGINYHFIMNREWEVKRTNKDGKVLAINKKGEIKFFDEPYTHTYKREVNSSLWKKELYKDDEQLKGIYICTSITIFILVVMMIIGLLKSDFEEAFVIFMIGLLFALNLVIIWDSKLTYNKYNNESDSPH
ncbi:MAG: hypothetical protein ABS951_06610 [Solibacillus sp.]